MSKKLICLVCFVLALGMVLTSVAKAELVAWWMFGEGSGDIAYDSSGNGHDGTLVGTPQWVSGPEGFGGALEFGPTGLSRIECGTFDPTNGTGQFTIALWAIWDGTGSNQHFFTKTASWGADTMMFQVEFWAAHSNPLDTDRVGISYEPNPERCCRRFSLMPAYEWVHLAFTFDGTNARGYLNSVDEVGPRAFSIGPSVDIPVYIGSAEPSRGRTFHGSLDDVRVYDYAMTRDEIRLLMVSGEDMDLTVALLPEPANGAIEVPQDTVLSWMPGEHSDTHDVYFGTVLVDVNEAGRDNDPNSILVSQNQGEATYDPPGLLEYGQTHYWRVDEFNDANPNSPWKGDVWSFTVIDYFIVVDDFESYNDLNPTDPNSNRIFLTWLDGYEQPTNGAIVGHADPPFAEQTIVRGGEQAMPLFYDNSDTANYSEAQRTFSPTQDWTIEGLGTLSLWLRGNPGYVGSFVEEPPGTYTMTASGEDIWSTDDELHFAYKELSGAAAIIAKVESLENTDPMAKAGVMIRDTLEVDSRNVAVLITPEKGVRFQYRSTTGGRTNRYFDESITAPQWVKLERTTGGLVRAYHSADGTAWTRLNMAVVGMDMPVYIGLAMTSHNVDATCEAKFSNVSFPDTSVGPQWTDQDIGILSNAPEPMYVTVGDGSGTAAKAYHADPDAALIDDWTEWNIPLTDFSGQGVVLTDVSKLAIGFGSADNPQPGGSGLMYFDDIRLYLPR